MPFDKISPQQLLVMRILTGVTFLAIGGGLAYLAGGCVLDAGQCATRFEGPAAWIYVLSALQFGVLLANAGMMLLELVTRPPFKMAINVPFVAGNFQTALCFGLIALGLSIRHATLPGDASSGVLTLQALCMAGFAMNLFFVTMTKMHWNFTENTGKALPQA